MLHLNVMPASSGKTSSVLLQVVLDVMNSGAWWWLFSFLRNPVATRFAAGGAGRD